jgi:hypothetical protein
MADDRRPPPPPADRPPGGHDRDARDGADNDELARFAQLLRSEHDLPLNVAAVNEDGNCLFRVVSLQVYSNASAHAEVRRRCLDYWRPRPSTTATLWWGPPLLPQRRRQLQ